MEVGDTVLFAREILGIAQGSQGNVFEVIGDLVRVRVTHHPDCSPHTGFNTPPLAQENFILGDNC
ncbi:hypothetical protein [Ekhidna sp.]|uniref:hypothetical protein n=1 Tax=Ekhidna sp. TaxID=2608089 RepID=UPI003BA99FFA